jgi:mono/diheme cytochrome c family protein
MGLSHAIPRLTAAALMVGLGLGTVACGSQPQPAVPPAGGVPQAAGTTAGQATAPVAGDAKEGAGDEAKEAAAGGDATAGEKVFMGTCVSCHGPDAKGLPGLGKDLHGNQFVAGKTDDDMVAFLTTGRPTDDPLNTTGVAMPPKGGNPALTNTDLLNVVAYVRALK